jgi:hypothetical protein
MQGGGEDFYSTNQGKEDLYNETNDLFERIPISGKTIENIC